MSNIEILKDYYKRVCTPLIFINETVLENCHTARVFLYDFRDEEELLNFKKIFQEYIPFYVKNFDRLERYDIPRNDDDIGNFLRKKANLIKQNEKILPARQTKMNGIYGEVFNDFYLRNVCTNERLIAYLARRSYEKPNTENHGIDIVVCSIRDDRLEVTFSEAKFVTDINAAKNDLKKDVSSHVKKEYINNYLQFVMQRQGELFSERKEEINNKINEFNDMIEETGVSFIDAINNCGFKIKFVFFALFQNAEREMVVYEKKINEIIDGFNLAISETEIINYDIDVVFVPTFNTSMNIKNKMEEWDG